MQITFDTTNPHDLSLLTKLLDLACHRDAQPEVAHNTGTAASEVLPPLSSEGSGVSEQGAADAAPAALEKPKRGRKPKAENPVVVKTGDEWVGAAKAVEELDAEVQAEAEAAEEPEVPAPVEQTQADPATFTIDEVRAALQQFTASKGVPAGIELLKKFGAGRISELAEGDYASFVAECSL